MKCKVFKLILKETVKSYKILTFLSLLNQPLLAEMIEHRHPPAA